MSIINSATSCSVPSGTYRPQNTKRSTMLRPQWPDSTNLVSEVPGTIHKETFMVTIFGYSAPASDKSAVNILKGAWGPNIQRNMEQFEIIDIQDEDELRDSWRLLFHTHHYEIHRCFYESWIAKHPRRTGEAYWNQYCEAKFVSDNNIPPGLDFPDIWDWYKPLVERERTSRSP